MVHVSEFKRPAWFGELREFPRAVGDYALYHGARAVSRYLKRIQAEQEAAGHHNALLHSADELVDSFGQRYEQQYKNRLFRSVGQFYVQYQFSQGTSSIEQLYTMAYKGALVPIAVKEKGKGEPTQEQIKQAIEYVVTNQRSPLNDDSISKFKRGDFGFAENQYFRGDKGAFIDPANSDRWICRLDTVPMGYSGRILEKDTAIDGNTYRLVRFDRASAFSTWLFWSFGDKLYDFIDSFFDPVQRMVERAIEDGLVPEQLRQYLAEQEFKAISGLQRQLWSRHPPIEFDPTHTPTKKTKGGAGGGNAPAPVHHLQNYLYDESLATAA